MTPRAHELGADSDFEGIDAAFREDDARRAVAPARTERGGPGRAGALPLLLRRIGAGVLCAATFAYTLQAFSGADDVERTFHFLGCTLALAAAGFFCGLRIRDDRGARAFLGLAAATVPAHFTVLGALLYSRFPWLSGHLDYPAYARFWAPDPEGAIVATAACVAALVPVAWLAFAALARPVARPLTAAFLLSSATLLVPTRHPDVIAGVALGALLVLVGFERRVLRPVPGLRTPEGRFARALLLSPIAILVGRSVHLYEVSSLLGAGVLAMAAAALFSVVPRQTRVRGLAIASQRASVPAAAAAAALAVDAVVGAFSLPASSVLPLFCLPVAVGLAFLSRRTLADGPALRTMAALLATGGMALELWMWPGSGSAALCLGTGIAATAYGHLVDRRAILACGALALAFALVTHLRFALAFEEVWPWASLAVLGSVTLVASSLVERHRRAFGREAPDVVGAAGSPLEHRRAHVGVDGRLTRGDVGA